MKRRSFWNGFVMALVLVAAHAPHAAAQQPITTAAESHSMWRDVLIGGAVGTGFGAGIGAMRKNFHTAECAVLSCNRVLEADTLAPIGAAIGVFGGWLAHVIRNHGSGGVARSSSPTAEVNAAASPTFMVAPALSRDRKGIFLRAQF